MRTRALSSESVRALGIRLNAGVAKGWPERVAELLDVPASTVRSWATPPSSRAHRPISGPASNLLLAYVVMLENGGLHALVTRDRRQT